jgi:dihydroorotate dehydrogenase (NAD+) catalytic subunit
LSGLINVGRLGGIVTKSVTYKPRKGNPPPRIVETAAGMINSIGLANIGVKRFVKEKVPMYASIGTRVIVSVAGETMDDYCRVVSFIEKEGSSIDGYELNISCPNTDKGGIFFGIDAEMSRELTGRIRDMTSKLLIVKLTPNVTSIGDIAKAVVDGGADCVSVVNSFLGMAVDIQTRKPKIKNVVGGLTGPCIKPLGLAKVYEVCKHVTVPVIGIGGISNIEDLLEYLITGASAVQVGTANFYEPAASVTIVDALNAYLDENSIENISSVTGSLKL